MIVAQDMTSMRRIGGRLVPPLALVCAFSFLGCATASHTVLAAPTLGYPVSLSQATVTQSGASYIPHDAQLVDHFRYSWKHWSMLWGTVPLTEPKDLAQVLQAEIDRREGNGIVNLTIRGDFGLTYYITALFVVIPDNVEITLEGDVVRLPSVPVDSDMPDVRGTVAPITQRQRDVFHTTTPPDPRAAWSERYQRMVATAEAQAKEAETTKTSNDTKASE
jgi:hypothetical protein